MLKMGHDAVRTARYKFIRERELEGTSTLFLLNAAKLPSADLLRL